MTTTASSSLLDVALSYLAAGRSVLPIAPGSKWPSYVDPFGTISDLKWKPYQSQQPTKEQIQLWFGVAPLLGIGIACGPVSGLQRGGVQYALEVLDVDDTEVLDQFVEAASWHGLDELLPRLLHQRTPGGAGHFAYLCTEIAGNTVLARRPKRPNDPDKGEAVTLIETRGTGGQAVVAPTPPGIHPDHPERGYVLVRGSWEALPIITPEERQALFEVAQSFNTYVAPRQVHTERQAEPPGTTKGERPGDHLNATADPAWWRDLLERHSWTLLYERGEVQQWQRPGKEGQGCSATLGKCGPYFYVFSSNAGPFEPEKAYSPFSAYTLLEHQGDWSAAARVLAGQNGSSRPTGTLLVGNQGRNGQTPDAGRPPDPPHQPEHGMPALEDRHYPYSDAYNALALVRAHGQNLRYCAKWKSWLTWTGTHWQRDTNGLVIHWQRQTVQGLGVLLVDMDKKEVAELVAHIKRSLNTSRLKAAMEQAPSWKGMSLDPEVFDTDPWLLNCANGTLDLRTGKLQPHRQDDFLTKCLPMAYNQDATCPLWERFLWRIMGGSQGEDTPDMSVGELENRHTADERARSLIAFLQRAIGYTLTGSTREQCLFLLHGITKTGKSTFLATLRALLGPYGHQADMESFMHKDRPEVRNDLADLAGSRYVCALEGQEGRRLAESLIKQMTGGVDHIKARFLFQEFFEYQPQFKIFLGTNHKPVIKDTDSAIWERIRLVPFTVQIPKAERDKNLDERLQAELPGILAWAVRGCLEWQRLGELGEPEAVVEATAGYRSEMDSLGRFIDECCLVSPQVRVKAGELYDAYKTWCMSTGEQAITLTAFGYRMEEQGFTKHKIGTIWRLGIGLATPSKEGN